MEDIICSSKDCDCKAEYHNDKEDSYYWEKCAYTLFNPKEWIKFGSISIIHIMMDLWMTLLDRLRDYVKEEQLELKWSELLEQMSDFEAEIEEISYELESILNKNQPKHLYMIQKRSINLKFKNRCFINKT